MPGKDASFQKIKYKTNRYPSKEKNAKRSLLSCEIPRWTHVRRAEVQRGQSSTERGSMAQICASVQKNSSEKTGKNVDTVWQNC